MELFRTISRAGPPRKNPLGKARARQRSSRSPASFTFSSANRSLARRAVPDIVVVSFSNELRFAASRCRSRENERERKRDFRVFPRFASNLESNVRSLDANVTSKSSVTDRNGLRNCRPMTFLPEFRPRSADRKVSRSDYVTSFRAVFFFFSHGSHRRFSTRPRCVQHLVLITFASYTHARTHILSLSLSLSFFDKPKRPSLLSR